MCSGFSPFWDSKYKIAALWPDPTMRWLKRPLCPESHEDASPLVASTFWAPKVGRRDQDRAGSLGLLLAVLGRLGLPECAAGNQSKSLEKSVKTWPVPPGSQLWPAMGQYTFPSLSSSATADAGSEHHQGGKVWTWWKWAAEGSIPGQRLGGRGDSRMSEEVCSLRPGSLTLLPSQSPARVGWGAQGGRELVWGWGRERKVVRYWVSAGLSLPLLSLTTSSESSQWSWSTQTFWASFSHKDNIYCFLSTEYGPGSVVRTLYTIP